MRDDISGVLGTSRGRDGSDMVQILESRPRSKEPAVKFPSHSESEGGSETIKNIKNREFLHRVYN